MFAEFEKNNINLDIDNINNKIGFPRFPEKKPQPVNKILRDLMFLLERRNPVPTPVEVLFPTWRGKEPPVPDTITTFKLKHTVDYDTLVELVKLEPQVKNDRMRYIITGGYAARLLVEAAGGQSRKDQHDLDIIVLTNDPIPKHDNWHRGNYVGALFFDERTLADNFVSRVEISKRKFGFLKEKKESMLVTSAEFLILSKLLGFGRRPRDKDISDILGLIRSIPLDREKLELAASLARFRDTHLPQRMSETIADEIMRIKSMNSYSSRAQLVKQLLAIDILAMRATMSQIVHFPKIR